MAEVESDVRERGTRRPSRLPARCASGCLGGLGAAGMRPAVAWVSASFVLLVGVVGGLRRQLRSPRTTEPAPWPPPSTSRTCRPPAAACVVPGDDEKGAILRVHGMPTLDGDSRLPGVGPARRRDDPESLFSVGEDGDGAAAVSEDLEGADA